MSSRINLLMDSGAFVANSRKVSISLDAYIDYLKSNRRYLWNYVNLDIIPSGDAEAAAKASCFNLDHMLAAGLTPMPVFHYGERFYWLEYLVKEGHQHIGIGGLVKLPSAVRYKFLDQVFTRLCGGAPHTTIKVHGFGVTSVKTMTRYPWASIDSKSWRRDAAYGWLLVPKKTDGEWDFSKPPYKVSLSNGATSRGRRLNASAMTQHLLNLGAGAQALAREWLEELKLTEEVLSSHTPEGRDGRRAAHSVFYRSARDFVRKHRPAFKGAVGLFKTEGLAPSLLPLKCFNLFSVVDSIEEVRFLARYGLTDCLVNYYDQSRRNHYDMRPKVLAAARF